MRLTRSLPSALLASTRDPLQYFQQSPSHFNRAFKSIFGNTPAEFVETLRLNEAKRRLSVPKRTLDTIAASVGFSGAGAYRRAFERKFGAKLGSHLNNLDLNSTAIRSNDKLASSFAH